MNTFGTVFRVSIFGESHGKWVGVAIDGCPAGMALCEDDLLPDLARRKAGATGTTPRKEDDIPIFVSGIFNNKTTGAPLTIVFENNNTRSGDYDAIKETPRPGHADFVLNKKFNGYNDYRGGGSSYRGSRGGFSGGRGGRRNEDDVVPERHTYDEEKVKQAAELMALQGGGYDQ